MKRLTSEEFKDIVARACAKHTLNIMSPDSEEKISGKAMLTVVLSSTISVSLLMREIFKGKNEVELTREEFSEAVNDTMDTEEFGEMIDGGIAGVLCGLTAVALYSDIEDVIFGKENDNDSEKHDS